MNLLTKNEYDLILYCCEQQASEFNAEEERDFKNIVKKLADYVDKNNSETTVDEKDTGYPTCPPRQFIPGYDD